MFFSATGWGVNDSGRLSRPCQASQSIQTQTNSIHDDHLNVSCIWIRAMTEVGRREKQHLSKYAETILSFWGYKRITCDVKIYFYYYYHCVLLSSVVLLSSFIARTNTKSRRKAKDISSLKCRISLVSSAASFLSWTMCFFSLVYASL